MATEATTAIGHADEVLADRSATARCAQTRIVPITIHAPMKGTARASIRCSVL